LDQTASRTLRDLNSVFPIGLVPLEATDRPLVRQLNDETMRRSHVTLFISRRN